MVKLIVKTSSKVALIAAFFLLIGGGLLWLANNYRIATPDQLITQTLKDAEDAARRGSVNGVMDTISDDFSAGGLDKAKVKLLLLKTMGQSRSSDYSVAIHPPKIMLSPKGRPDERLVTTQFAAFNPDTGEDIYRTSEPPVLLMRQETRRKWLFFSEPYWRVAGVVNMPALPGSMSNGDYGGLLP